jgi:hypothetical protein
MSKMKTFIERVSEDMGKGGEIDDDVLREAQRRMDRMTIERSNDGVDLESVFRVQAFVRRHCHIM